MPKEYPPLTMFNAYVSNLSTSIGWGGQGGSMQLKLVEDPENDKIIPKDSNGDPFTGNSPNSPKVGSACYFKYGNFYFGGIFQRWTYSESVSGRTYDIILESPAKLMDGVQCIVEDFNSATDIFIADSQGGYFSTNVGGSFVGYGTAGLNNIYNLFAYYETPYDGFFGASNFNSSGVEVDKLLYALNYLAKGNSPSYLGGPIVYKQTNYDLNVDEVLNKVTQVWSSYDDAYRIKGPVQSVNGLIQDISNVLQLDYYYEVRHNVSNFSVSNYDDGGGVISNALINVRVVDKGVPPNPRAIREFVAAEKDSGMVVSYSVGQEFGDAVNQRMIYGGNRTRYQLAPIATCEPIWGARSEIGNPHPYNTQGLTYDVQSGPNKPIYINLGNDFNNAVYIATLFEIRMALGGKQSWETFKTFETMAGVEPNGYNNLFACPWTGSFGSTKDVLNFISEGSGNSYDMVQTNTEMQRKQYVKSANEFADKIFSSVSVVANTYYCQQFLVPMVSESGNYNQMNYNPPGDFKILKAWETSDAAFVQNKLCTDLKFFDGDGRQKSMVAYTRDPLADFSSLGSDYANGAAELSGYLVSSKGTPDKEMYWDGNTHWVAYKTGGQVRYYDYITTPDFGLTVLAKYFFNLDIPPENYIKPGNSALQLSIPPDCFVPAVCGVPQQSNRYNYGPWITLSSASTFDAKAEVQHDESMRPETYGGYAALNVIGGISATTGAGAMTELESGYIEVVGAPAGSLGERFAASGPFVSDLSINVSTSGVKTTYKFNTYTPNFGKLAKYNVDRIAKVNKNSFAYAQKYRDKIEKRPFPAFKFEKTDFSDLAKRFQQTDTSGWSILAKKDKDVEKDGMGKPGGGTTDGNVGSSDFGGFN